MTCQNDPVVTLRLQLHQLPCPACGRHDLVPMLLCDYYPDGCLWLARCDSCRAQYHIDQSRSPEPGGRNRPIKSTGGRNPARAAT